MRSFLLITSLVLLTQCAHRQETSKQAPAHKVEWYIASKEPLTYCPKGQRLPKEGELPEWGTEYIFLADRRTRFYIPPQHPHHRQQALALKLASSKEPHQLGKDTQQTMKWVASTPLRLALTMAFVAFGQGPTDIFAQIWER